MQRGRLCPCIAPIVYIVKQNLPLIFFLTYRSCFLHLNHRVSRSLTWGIRGESPCCLATMDWYDYHQDITFKQYSDALWDCIYHTIESDVKRLGKYGPRYDKVLLCRIRGMDNLILAFRREGLLAINLEVQKALKLLLGNIDL